MKTLIKFIFILLFVNTSYGQNLTAWSLFESATFKEVPVEEFYVVDVLIKTKEISEIENTEITISGYFIPTGEEDVIIISKMPMASCFFCGGAGLESLLVIKPKQKIKRRFYVDQIITFKGYVQLNYTDYDELPFILTSAEFIQ